MSNRKPEDIMKQPWPKDIYFWLFPERREMPADERETVEIILGLIEPEASSILADFFILKKPEEEIREGNHLSGGDFREILHENTEKLRPYAKILKIGRKEYRRMCMKPDAKADLITLDGNTSSLTLFATGIFASDKGQDGWFEDVRHPDGAPFTKEEGEAVINRLMTAFSAHELMERCSVHVKAIDALSRAVNGESALTEAGQRISHMKDQKNTKPEQKESSVTDSVQEKPVTAEEKNSEKPLPSEPSGCVADSRSLLEDVLKTVIDLKEKEDSAAAIAAYNNVLLCIYEKLSTGRAEHTFKEIAKAYYSDTLDELEDVDLADGEKGLLVLYFNDQNPVLAEFSDESAYVKAEGSQAMDGFYGSPICE